MAQRLDKGVRQDTAAPPSATPEQRGGFRLSARAETIVLPIAAVVIALIIGAVLMWFEGNNPFTAYRALLSGALGGKDEIARTLEKATPLILTGLAVIVALKAGLFNIGAQGQLLLGAIFAAYVGYKVTWLPTVLHVPLCLVVGGIFGLLPAALAGVLKAYRGAHEVITTIMLNSIIVNLTEWLAGGPWQQKGTAISRTPPIQSTAKIPKIWGMPLGFFIAVLSAVACWYLIKRTTVGFRLTTVGQNKNAAGYGGMSVARITVLAMAISGFLAGLGGAIETQGVVGRYEPGFNSALGFDGITVALLARTEPLLAIPASLLIGIMRAGSTKMQFDAHVEPEIIDVILAIILLLVAAPIVVRWILRLKKARGEEDTLQLTSGWGA
jgi:general nucleoside transport system permease protein